MLRERPLSSALASFRPRLSWLLLTGTVVLSYHVRIDYAATGGAVWEEELWIRLLEYAPFYAVWLGEQIWLRRRRGQLAPQAFEA